MTIAQNPCTFVSSPEPYVPEEFGPVALKRIAGNRTRTIKDFLTDGFPLDEDGILDVRAIAAAWVLEYTLPGPQQLIQLMSLHQVLLALMNDEEFNPPEDS